MDREGFKNRMKQYKKAREENPGLKYYDFMERLAEFKAKEWNDDPDMVLQHMLNDNSYNYQLMYEDNPNFNIQEGHFVDTYKTAYHPTFSEESMYSGKKSPYNPEGIVGGSWDESTKSFYLNDKRQSKRKAQDYLNYADPGYRAIPKYDEGTDGVGNKKAIPTQEEYIAQQIAAEKAAALAKSLSRTMPRVPLGEKRGERWNPHTGKVENIYELGSSCAYTFADNYGLNWMSSEDFRQNHANYGWKQVPWEQRQPGDAVLIVDDKGTARHTMMYDSDNAHGQPLFNHSNGGHDESAIRKKAKYPHHNPYLTYEFVGTPADSTQWKNEYKQLYGYAEGGEVEPNPLEVLERSKPKVAGIPINDKPLSGTDPIGELYLNLVSGNAVRKAIKNGINTVVRKSFYDSYKALLKAGWNRRKAYEYASPELGVGILPGITKGFDYTIKGANYTHAVNDFIK